MSAMKACLSRLKNDMSSFHKDPPPFINVAVNERNMTIWHYLLEGPPGSPYDGGWYWGRLKFPNEYPFKPPSVQMHTPSGRFQTNVRLCLSMSDFHPESWNPSWSLATVLLGLLSFMLEETPTTGSISSTLEERKAFAAKSAEFNRGNAEFCALFPEFDSIVQAAKERRERQGATATTTTTTTTAAAAAASTTATSSKHQEEAERRKTVGNELFAKGQYSEAEAEYSAAILLNPGISVYYGNRSAARLMLRRFDQSLADCDRALQIDPKGSKYQLRAAKCLNYLGHPAKAMERLTILSEGELPSGYEEEVQAAKVIQSALDKLNGAANDNHLVQVIDKLPPEGENVRELLMVAAARAPSCILIQRAAAMIEAKYGSRQKSVEMLQQLLKSVKLADRPEEQELILQDLAHIDIK